MAGTLETTGQWDTGQLQQELYPSSGSSSLVIAVQMIMSVTPGCYYWRYHCYHCNQARIQFPAQKPQELCSQPSSGGAQLLRVRGRGEHLPQEFVPSSQLTVRYSLSDFLNNIMQYTGVSVKAITD